MTLVCDAGIARCNFSVKLYRRGIKPKPEVIETIQSLDIEHVIQIFEHGPVGDDQYFELQEYAEFGSLLELLWKDQITLNNNVHDVPTAQNDAVIHAVFLEIFTAITHINENEVVHRDVKPANILVRSLNPFDLVLTDFGLARDSSGGLTNINQGTAYYLAPEALSHEYHAFKNDFWALGVITYELLKRKHPFLGDVEGTIYNQLNKALVPIAVTGVSEPWKVLLEGLLQRRLEWRWGPNEVRAWLNAHEIKDGVIKQVRVFVAPARAAYDFAAPYNFVRDDGQAIALVSLETMAFHLSESPIQTLKDLNRGKLSMFFSEQGVRQSDENLKKIGRDITIIESETVSQNPLANQIEIHLKLVSLLHPGLPPYLMGKPVSLENLDEIVRLAKSDFDTALMLDSAGTQTPNLVLVQYILFNNFFGRYAELFTGQLASLYRTLQDEITAQLSDYHSALTTQVPDEAAPRLFDQYTLLEQNLVTPQPAKAMIEAWQHCLMILLHCVQKLKSGDQKARDQYEDLARIELHKDKTYVLAGRCPWYASIGQPLNAGYSRTLVLNYFLRTARAIVAAETIQAFKAAYESLESTARGFRYKLESLEISQERLLDALESPTQIAEIKAKANLIRKEFKDSSEAIEAFITEQNPDQSWLWRARGIHGWFSRVYEPNHDFVNEFCLSNFADVFSGRAEVAQKYLIEDYWSRKKKMQWDDRKRLVHHTIRPLCFFGVPLLGLILFFLTGSKKADRYLKVFQAHPSSELVFSLLSFFATLMLIWVIFVFVLDRKPNYANIYAYSLRLFFIAVAFLASVFALEKYNVLPIRFASINPFVSSGAVPPDSQEPNMTITRPDSDPTRIGIKRLYDFGANSCNDMGLPGLTKRCQITVDSGQSYAWGSVWCATKPSFWPKVLNAARFQYFIDGQSISTGRFWAENTKTCLRRRLVVSNMQSGSQHEFKLVINVIRNVNDGSSIIKAGKYVLALGVRVN